MSRIITGEELAARLGNGQPGQFCPTCPQSGQAADKLTKLGYSNVLQFEGGLEEWKKGGQEVVSGAGVRAA